jgi:ATP-dependent RNA helicase DHX29
MCLQLISNSTSIDRKIRFRTSPKANIALKYLRGQLASLLASQFRGKVLTETNMLWNQVALTVLGKDRVAEEDSLANIVVS